VDSTIFLCYKRKIHIQSLNLSPHTQNQSRATTDDAYKYENRNSMLVWQDSPARDSF
jgi:hypothetical protein